MVLSQKILNLTQTLGQNVIDINPIDSSFNKYGLKEKSVSQKPELVLSNASVFKVMGDSLLIHEFAYSLFICLCLVTSNMTGYSHSNHSIKLIHCGAPQRDVLSDKIVF